MISHWSLTAIMANNRLLMRKIFISLFVLFIAFTLAYHNNFFYSQLKKLPYPLNPYLIQLADDTVNEFNFFRIIKQESLPQDDYIDLIMSGDDLRHISDSMKLFIDEGYIRDQSNLWRKAKIIINGEKEKIKYKFHGTSVSPLNGEISYLFSLVMKKFGFIDTLSGPTINSGRFSLKVKHKKESGYYNLMRRYNLISHHDDAEISTIVINKIASKLGLMAPHGRMTILRINGAEIGAYMLVEAHNKEWFEREHQLTNYTIFKSNDDWDRKGGHPHASDTDLYIGNKKINTISQDSSVAVGSLELLLKSIRNNDVDQIKKMLDMDYMAKYMALLSITNTNHPISGDNLRYIYNHATGRFKMLFRIEGSVHKNSQKIDKFNHSLFISPYENLETHKLFKLLLTDSSFLIKRDKELYKIIQNNKEWEALADEAFSKNIKVLLASNEPMRPIKFKIKQFKSIFANNIEKARQYLDYSKIFITKYTDINGKQSLRILNDFTHPIMLKGISKVSDLDKEINIILNPAQIDIKQQTVYEEQVIDNNAGDVSRLVFENAITRSGILPRHVYFNDAIVRPSFSKDQSLQTLNDNNVKYKVNYKDKVITLQSGQHRINNNIILPYGFNLVLQAGTQLLFNKDISFLVRGGLNINGTKSQPVIVSRLQNEAAFGVFAVAGENILNTEVNIDYLEFGGGGEAIVNGSLFTGQMSIHNANVVIKNSIFENSISDDGVNIKYSKVDISDSKFINNFGDQIDLDYCQATIVNNIFSYKVEDRVKEISSTDGLDISGSKVQAIGNTFSNLSDKGISVGEISNIMISDNIFKHNNLAIAVKDGSKAFIDKNQFNNNNIDISMYIKKKIYKNPSLYMIRSNKILNFKVDNGDIFYLDDLNEGFGNIK